MALRHKFRELYIEGWYELDIHKLLESVSEDFQFIDPMELKPIGKADLQDYMSRWNRRAGHNQKWKLSHEVRQDKGGVLTDWEWWEVLGTELEGSAIVRTTDCGVEMEKITYLR